MAYYAYGFDYTGGLNAATIDRATIDGYQIRFVCRYLSGFSKDLTPSEAKALSAAGVSIVVVWETTATRAEAGHAAGVADAKAALAEAKRCGMPDGRPIYMAVDEDTTVGPHVSGYFQGVNSVLGVACTGVYGSYKVCKALHEAGLVTWMWQTYAWSGGQWYGPAQLQQYSNDHTLSGHGVDYDRATKTDYGQWRVGVTPAPQPQEEDMLSGKIAAGKGDRDPILFPSGAFKTVYFGWDNTYTNADLGITREGPAQLRIALHQPGRKGAVPATVVVGAALDDSKGWSDNVKVALPAGCDRIDITRLDDGTRSVGFCVA